MANFTDQKPRIATAEDLKRPWSGHRDGSCFRCYLCGHKFEVGDQYRWVYSNGTPGAGGNPMVCASCDGPNEEVIARWKAMHEEARTRFWWFTQEER